MKRSTKSLWVYASVLFIIAIGLIFAATMLQARLISSDGGFEVLGTFTRNANQSIKNLTEENIRLSGELDEQTKKNEELGALYDELKAQYDKNAANSETIKQMYEAYGEKDYDALGDLLEKITPEEADELLPGFYKTAKRAYDTNAKN